MYKEHRLYRISGNALHLYICLEQLLEKKFIVQQMEIIPNGCLSDIKDIMCDINQRFFELISEERDEQSEDWSESLVLAIQKHDRAFKN